MTVLRSRRQKLDRCLYVKGVAQEQMYWTLEPGPRGRLQGTSDPGECGGCLEGESVRKSHCRGMLTVLLQRQGGGRDDSACCLLHISGSLVSQLFSHRVGRTVCSQATGVHQRSAGFQSLLTSSTGHGPLDPSTPPQGKSLDLNRPCGRSWSPGHRAGHQVERFEEYSVRQMHRS